MRLIEQQKALETIANVDNYCDGVTYEQYVQAYGFKGSPSCLRSHLAGRSVRTIQNMIRLQNYLDVQYGSIGGQL